MVAFIELDRSGSIAHEDAMCNDTVRIEVPQGEAAMDAAAASVGLTVDPACREGVLMNLRLLAQHLATLRGGDR